MDITKNALFIAQMTLRALLRYSHAIPFAHVKYKPVDFRRLTESDNHHHCQFQNPCPSITAAALSTAQQLSPSIDFPNPGLHMNGTMYRVVFYGWLLSFSVMFSRLTHAVTSGTISFLFMANSYSIVCTYHGSFIHSSGGFHLWPL